MVYELAGFGDECWKFRGCVALGDDDDIDPLRFRAVFVEGSDGLAFSENDEGKGQ